MVLSSRRARLVMSVIGCELSRLKQSKKTAVFFWGGDGGGLGEEGCVSLVAPVLENMDGLPTVQFWTSVSNIFFFPSLPGEMIQF